MKQTSRTIVMEAFKGGRVRVLIATDVAARGLDVDNVDIVFNYDLPQDMEYYVHRIGRTGRAGKTGVSFTLLSGRREISEIAEVERFTKSKIKQNQIPSLSEVAEAKNGRLIGEIKAEIFNGLPERYSGFIERMEDEGISASEAAAALLKMRFSDISDIPEDAVDELLLSARKQERVRVKDGMPKFGRDKDDKHEKSPRRKKGSMTKLLINAGKNDKVTANHILGAIAGETSLAGKDVGGIHIYDTYTLAEVPKESAELVVRLMSGCKIKGKKTVTKIYNG